MVCVFCGQLAGTAVGNRLFAEGGWRASGGCSVGFVGLALVFCGCRGPWEKGWVGWRGGWGIRRRDLGKKVEVGVEEVVKEGEKMRNAGLEEKSEGTSGSESEKVEEIGEKVKADL